MAWLCCCRYDENKRQLLRWWPWWIDGSSFVQVNHQRWWSRAMLAAVLRANPVASTTNMHCSLYKRSSVVRWVEWLSVVTFELSWVGHHWSSPLACTVLRYWSSPLACTVLRYWSGPLSVLCLSGKVSWVVVTHCKQELLPNSKWHWQQMWHGWLLVWTRYRKKERKSIYLVPFIYYVYLKALRHGSHIFSCKYTMPAFPS